MLNNLATEITLMQSGEKITSENIRDAFTELERGVFVALETYSNVHRGSGQCSLVSTHLYEMAREIVLEYLGLSKDKYVVIFCTARRETVLKSMLEPETYISLSSHDIGLPLGVRALAVIKRALPQGIPFQAGGGTTRLVSPDWIIWADVPDKFEAGTPPIINVITYAKALLLVEKYGTSIFLDPEFKNLTVDEILFHDEFDKFSGKELLDQLRLNLIGRNIPVPTIEGYRPYINLDNSASTPASLPVWNTVRQTWHQSRQVQKDIIQEVRKICTGFLGASPDKYDMIFTSNTTEAINLAAESLNLESQPETQPVLLNSLLEHSSNDLPWRIYSNFSLIRLSIDKEGFLDMNELNRLLSEYNRKCLHGSKRIKIVAISGVSNVLGVYNNLEEISRIIHQNGARLLVDAAQMVAHRKVDIERIGIDYLAFSAHKVYAPFGCGVLIVKKGILNFSTDELEQIKLSGEENSGGIAALGKSLFLLQRIGLDLIQKEEQELTGKALNGLSKIRGLKIYGISDPVSTSFAHRGGVIVFSLKSMMAHQVAKELALRRGIGVRSGCHCAHILVKHLLGVGPALEGFQRVLVKLFSKLSPPGIVRVSFGIGNSDEDIDTLIHVLMSMAEKHELPKSDVQKQIDDYIKSSGVKVYYQP